jgi:hypothetical protein
MCMLRKIHASILLPAILVASFLYVHSVRGEVRVAGHPEAVQVEARDAPVQEVLAALNASFGLQYRGVASLDRRISGTYEGPLQRVVRRLLDGYDFIAKMDAGTVEVVIIGAAVPGKIWAPPPVAAPLPTKLR